MSLSLGRDAEQEMFSLWTSNVKGEIEQ